jgi:hypothetical protein
MGDNDDIILDEKIEALYHDEMLPRHQDNLSKIKEVFWREGDEANISQRVWINYCNHIFQICSAYREVIIKKYLVSWFMEVLEKLPKDSKKRVTFLRINRYLLKYYSHLFEQSQKEIIPL